MINSDKHASDFYKDWRLYPAIFAMLFSVLVTFVNIIHFDITELPGLILWAALSILFYVDSQRLIQGKEFKSRPLMAISIVSSIVVTFVGLYIVFSLMMIVWGKN